MSTKVRVTRQDFRDATKVCRLNGHAICRCVVAKAVIRAGIITEDTCQVGFSGMSGQSPDGKYVSLDSGYASNMNKLVCLFDHKYEDTSADKMYQEAKNQNILQFELK